VDVQASAEYLLARGAQLEPDLAIMLDSRIPDIPFDFGPDCKTVRFLYRDIPKFPAGADGTITYIVTAQKRKVVILHGTLLYNEGLLGCFCVLCYSR
jgi:hypothetical protein